MKSTGFTLVELMLSLAILGIIASVAVPSFTNMINNEHVIGATERIYQELLYARSEAVKQNTKINLSLRTGSTWCFGVTDSGTCNCNSNNCKVNNVLKKFTKDDYSNTSLTFSPSLDGAAFEPTKGFIELSGAGGIASTTITVTGVNSQSATITVNQFGRLSICAANNLGKYKSC